MNHSYVSSLHPFGFPCVLSGLLAVATGCPGSGGGDTDSASTSTPGTTQEPTGTAQTGPGTTPGEVTLETPTQGTTPGTTLETTTPGEETTTSTTGPGDTTTTGGTTSGPDPDDPALNCAQEPCFNVINKCPFPIWVHAENNAGVVLMPDNTKLAPGGEQGNWQQYPVPAEWPAGRVNAYYNDPAQAPNDFDKVEMTVTGGVMNYNITYSSNAA